MESKRGERVKHEIRADEAGCLYDTRAREMIASSLDMPRREMFEAMAALGWAARRMHRAMERWSESHGLSQGRLQVLIRLKHEADGVPLGELAEMLRVSPRNITGLIDNLERDGLVKRAPDPSDRRSILAQLTDHGRERVSAVWSSTLDAQMRLAEGFTSDEMVQLRHLCLRLIQRMDEPRHSEV